MKKIMSGIVGGVVFAALGYLSAVGRKKYVSYCEKQIPDIFRNPERNYDEIVLGEYPGKYISEEKKSKCLYLNGYKRNFYTDILIMERYYSFLRKGGTIIFVMDLNNKKYFTKNRISIFDDKYFHVVTLLEHGKNTDTMKYQLSEYYKGFLFLLTTYLQREDNGNKKRNIVSDKRVFPKHVRGKMEDIKKFCETRGILVKFLDLNNEEV